MSSHPEQHKYGPRGHPPLWERIVAGLGLLTVIGLLGYLLYEAVAGDHSPPNILVDVVEVRDNGEDFLVIFEVRNAGGTTASSVVITGELARFGIVTEAASATLDFVPAESTRHGGLFFRHDPREATLRLTPSGYVVP